MSRNTILMTGLLVVIGLAISLNAAATTVSVKFCTKWKAHFVDDDVGEDDADPDDYEYRPAMFSKYYILIASTNGLIQQGYLDGSGCTPFVTLESGTSYKFMQGTFMRVTGDRMIYVNPTSVAPPQTGTTWVSSYYTPSSWPSSQMKVFQPNWNAPQSNIMAAAANALKYYNSREFPADFSIQIWPGDFVTSAGGPGQVLIDINHLYKGVYIDQSQYKFVVCHEIGHTLARESGAPYFIDDNAQSDTCTSVAKCNCSQLAGSPSMCIQSREYIKTAEMEAWAYFYSTALFNNQETDCFFGYWHEMYTGSTPQSATIDQYPPVTVDCSDMPKWQDNLCPADDKGVLQDWLGFYWNVWTNGPYKYTVDEMSDVYSRPEVSDDLYWDELVAAVIAKYPSDPDKRDQFIDMGALAGVNY